MAGEALSPIFNQPGIAGFTFMRAGEKFPPREEGWQKKGHSFEEAIAHIVKGGNVGILASNGYIGLDQDSPVAFEGLTLPSTTTWETRPGRLGIWFKCNDRTPEVLAKYGFRKPDQAQIKLYDGRRIIEGYHPHVGEIKLERTYQVIPPSWKEIDGQRVNYRMLEEIPPAEISLDWLLSELLRIGIVFSEKPKDSRPKDNAQRLEGLKKDAISKRLNKISKAKEFLLEAAMRAKPGFRNDTGFWLACQLRDLGLEAGEASEYMRDYAKGLEDSEAEPYTQDEAMESLKQAYSRDAREPPKSQTNQESLKAPQLSDKVIRVGDNILKRGRVLKFLTRQAQRNHIGDTDVIKHFLASIASTNSATSSGIQPELNGPKGRGKTDACRSVFHLISLKWKLAASISAKSLYYYKDLPTGAILFSDDVEWSLDLIATVKRSMGTFQEPQTHFTLDRNRNPVPMTMPARLAWWLSSVESVADDQLKDRQYSLDIDESSDHTEKVSEYLRCSRAQKTVRFSVDWRIEVARYIIDQIKSHEPFKVIIPCAKATDWKIKDDHRMQNKFWDLVEAFAILRYKQRYIDSDGWLHATVEDFNEAKTIFMKRKANHRTKLTDAQTKVVKSILALQKEGATQARISEDLGISPQAVSKSLKAIMANTRFIVSSPGLYGETFYRATVSSLEVAYEEGDIVTLPPDYEDPLNYPINHQSTILSTIETNNSKPKQLSYQPNKERYNNVEVADSGESDDHEDCYAQKIGLKGLKEAADSERVGLKDGCVSTSEDQTLEPLNDADIILKYGLPNDPVKRTTWFSSNLVHGKLMDAGKAISLTRINEVLEQIAQPAIDKEGKKGWKVMA